MPFVKFVMVQVREFQARKKDSVSFLDFDDSVFLTFQMPFVKFVMVQVREFQARKKDSVSFLDFDDSVF